MTQGIFWRKSGLPLKDIGIILSLHSFFEGSVADKIRLSEVIERKLLSPFHYFGVTDNVDLSQVQWLAGKYDKRELENLYVFEKAIAQKRVGYVINTMGDIVFCQ